MEQATALSREQLSADLRAVQLAVGRSKRPVMTPPSIALYWGTATLIGFSLLDFARDWAGWFWLVAGSVGAVYCWWIGKRLGRKFGEADSLEGWREFWHWMGMAVAVVLLGLPTAQGKIAPGTTGQLALLIVAYTYFHAWVRRGDLVTLVAGLIMAAGYAALNWVSRYTWTMIGVSVFVAMGVGSVVAWRATWRELQAEGA